MKKIALLFVGLLFATPLWAADNAVIVTPGTGVTMKSKDVGSGVQSMQPSLIDQAGAEILGQVTASPAANTIGARLKSIVDNTGAAIPAGTSIIGKVGIDQTTPGTTNGVQVNAALPAGTNTIGTAGQLPYPVGAVPYTATATGTTGATTATLAGASSVTTYLCGFSIRANATAAATGNATVTGVITATLNFTQWTAPNASGLGVTEMIFAPCIPASGTNQSVAVVSAAPGTGGVVSVTAWGYKL